jgi:hypothetical protein
VPLAVLQTEKLVGAVTVKLPEAGLSIVPVITVLKGDDVADVTTDGKVSAVGDAAKCGHDAPETVTVAPAE